MNFKKYLGDEQYSEFCNYRREFKYTNSNYISDGLSDDEVFQKAREFIDEAQMELVKSGEYQHALSSNLKNLLVIKEFAPVISDSYLDEQLKITHNIFAYTIDNWKSVRCALGKQRYTLNGKKYIGYGLNADFCIASTIIGANINNGNGTFSVDPSGNVKSSSIAITGGSFNINNRFIVDANGNITLPNNATIAWSNVTGTENVAFKNDIPTDGYITTISRNAITTSLPLKIYVSTRQILSVRLQHNMWLQRE